VRWRRQARAAVVAAQITLHRSDGDPPFGALTFTDADTIIRSHREQLI